jgi:hypothetical protein
MYCPGLYIISELRASGGTKFVQGKVQVRLRAAHAPARKVFQRQKRQLSHNRALRSPTGDVRGRDSSSPLIQGPRRRRRTVNNPNRRENGHWHSADLPENDWCRRVSTVSTAAEYVQEHWSESGAEDAHARSLERAGSETAGPDHRGGVQTSSDYTNWSRQLWEQLTRAAYRN